MFDFSGWATKNDVRCRDGRIIRKNAFKDMDGVRVPLVWSHDHKSPENVLGHAVLKNKDEGVYAYCSLNDETKGGRQTKSLIKHGDINSLSIFANDLVERGHEVVHGVIRELSVCLAGANPLAVIDNVMCHGGVEDADGNGIIIYGGDSEPIIVHSDEGDNDMFNDEEDDENLDYEEEDDVEEEDDEDEAEDLEDDDEDEDDEDEEEDEDEYEDDEDDENIVKHSANLTADDILDTLTEEQFNVVDAIINDAYNKGLEDGGNEMKHSVWDNEKSVEKKEVTLSHDAMNSLFSDAQSCGSLKQACIAHAADYGIDDINMLFPDPKATSTEPEFIKKRTEWVAAVMNGVKHVPFSRIKSIFADITEEEARAKGYVKGNRKIEEVFGLLKRETSPTTIYKKQKFDRDDILDVKDFNVVAWVRQEMRIKLEEEVARAILIGDGRSTLSPDKIKEDCIRPIWKDDELFTIKNNVAYSSSDTAEMKAKKFIKTVIKTRKSYTGSGNLTMFCGEDILADMLLIEDKNERVIYDTVEKLKTVLRVKNIVSCPLLDGLTRDDGTNTYTLGAILVDLGDYSVGTDKGGEINSFDDFDIDFNQLKYLMETRFSGALTKPYSAMVYEFAVTGTVDPAAYTTDGILFTGDTVKASDICDGIYFNSENIVGECYKQTGWTAFSATASKNTGYFFAFNAGSGNTVSVIGEGEVKAVTASSGAADATHVVRVDNKHKCKVVVTDGTITKTYAVTGLKMYENAPQ